MNNIFVANAPCSWGVLEFGLEGEAAGCAQVLDEMRDAGYSGTEFGDWGFMPTEPHALQDAVSQRGLTLLAAFIPVALSIPEKLDAGLEHALKTARLLQTVNPNAFIVLADENGSVPDRTQNAGRIQSHQSLNPKQWKIFTANADQVAKTVGNETGLRTVFHHHCAGYIETPDEIDYLLQHTNGEWLGLCFDTGHYTYGGGNALGGLQKNRERIWHVHFKDCSPEVAETAAANNWDYFEAVKNGVFCELGKGCVDFPSVLQTLRDSGYEGWIVVEQDVLPGMGSPFESAKRNREYLHSIGL